MKPPLKLKNISEVEAELNIIILSQHKPKYDLTVFQIFEFLSLNIETSIQSAGLKNTVGFWNRFLGKYKFAKLISSGNYSKANQIAGFPSKPEQGDEKSAETRLKTALTAFKLHSGPFGDHPVYGVLDKKQWERVLSLLSSFLFGYIQLEGDEKLRYLKEKEAKKEKFEQIKQDQREVKYNKENSATTREGNHSKNNNRRWKNKKKNNYKGNKNHGGGHGSK